MRQGEPYPFAGGFPVCAACGMLLEVLEVLAYELQHAAQHSGIHYEGVGTAEHDKTIFYHADM